MNLRNRNWKYGKNLPQTEIKKKRGIKSKLATLIWTTVDLDGSLFSKGKHKYYAIVVRGVPKDHPKDCIIELYVADKEMTITDIKHNPEHYRIKLLSRQVVLGEVSPMTNIPKIIEEMKITAEKEERANPYSSLSSAFTLK